MLALHKVAAVFPSCRALAVECFGNGPRMPPPLPSHRPSLQHCETHLLQHFVCLFDLNQHL